jgi:hypothetical protein
MAGSGSGRTLLLPWVDRHKTRETHPFFRHPGGVDACFVEYVRETRLHARRDCRQDFLALTGLAQALIKAQGFFA